ncbi:hypothetical protein TNCV_4416351 [Trichonephila clavipes]|uniref:Uncharacterized protein n=1 Tax=Trichonephila clavipes TaxID=2585209 RepID=A0A8X6VFW8_TRICX|nr:hypothetical protein TNCV_4416351 [Trichonephila clavipes]
MLPWLVRSPDLSPIENVNHWTTTPASSTATSNRHSIDATIPHSDIRHLSWCMYCAFENYSSARFVFNFADRHGCLSQNMKIVMRSCYVWFFTPWSSTVHLATLRENYLS